MCGIIVGLAATSARYMVVAKSVAAVATERLENTAGMVAVALSGLKTFGYNPSLLRNAW